ncbi:RNA 2'-phosphotransferase [Achromobacter deleyi]|uniref:RNA 2'-phosphotransferase n=1 Tax=Achromobacter deleyi TaxID=1353891 RepID=UPI0014924328|nr:RNA 2'-phosphotransferase [Achromobacter deleyi]QVQ26168.1 RNA 2'-phosphotransferase [Achromobacter deleyi]UIP21730.1 RNA 2'-phosphotransferase [Achromobacter deleyi]
MSNHHTDISKFLSYVLRHEPQTIGLTLDSEGWAEIDALIAGAKAAGKELDLALIREVAASSDKKRFAISENEQRIRAVQGHSTATVAVQHKAKEPPEFLYHGTATRFLDSILAEGLRPGQRHHVHLSQDIATATTVGQRHGKPVVLKIKARLMQQQGFGFFQADNGVWLTANVPASFLVLQPEPS